MTINVDGKDVYKYFGSKIDTWVDLAPGTRKVLVKAWDNKGVYAHSELTITVSSSGNVVTVEQPTGGSTVSSPVRFVASASSPNGVASMTINVDSWDAFKTPGSKVDTSIALGGGTHKVIVKAWDNKGNYFDKPLTITVGAASTGGTSTPMAAWWDIQKMANWGSCSECAGPGGWGPRATWYMNQFVGNPSLSGASTEYHIGGDIPYSAVLWNKKLIGDFGDPDPEGKVKKAKKFVYETWFYFKNAHAVEAMEFDTNQFFDNKSFIWGHECRVLGGRDWRIWNNKGNYWMGTGIPCNPKEWAWNHLIIESERTWDNKLFYVSVTLNGQKYYINRYDDPSWKEGWYGVTINFQLDGNYQQEDYSVWLDWLNFKMW